MPSRGKYKYNQGWLDWEVRTDLADIENKISHEKYSPPYYSVKVPNQETEEKSIENLPPKKGTKFEEEVPKSVVNLEN